MQKFLFCFQSPSCFSGKFSYSCTTVKYLSLSMDFFLSCFFHLKSNLILPPSKVWKTQKTFIFFLKLFKNWHQRWPWQTWKMFFAAIFRDHCYSFFTLHCRWTPQQGSSFSKKRDHWKGVMRNSHAACELRFLETLPHDCRRILAMHRWEFDDCGKSGRMAGK